jgi:LDH2 family malate/lactate/ureidoglycolate dehydrogenase
MSEKISLFVEQAAGFIAGLFARAGLSPAASAEMGHALVDTDVADLPSHGLSQAAV